MKWLNKGHEVDVVADKMIVDFDDDVNVFVFGAGLLGKDLSRLLEKHGRMAGFVDNYREKQGTIYCGKKVISLDEYMNLKEKKRIIVAASKANTPVIRSQLEEIGLQHQNDFWTYEEFLNEIFPIFSFYHLSKSFTPLVQISLTERCTLRCKKCSHGCHAVPASAEDMSLPDSFRSADSFFKIVDYVNEFVLIGGEPLLYKNLGQVIEYIGEKYRERINIYSITTNGTILPSEDILLKCKKFGVMFRISNYSFAIPKLKEQYKRLTKLLEKYDIMYRLSPEEIQWMDYGFEYMDRKAGPEELSGVFDACKTPCREVRGNRLYFCVMARSIADNLHYNLGEHDYLELDQLHGLEGKKILLEYTLGYSDKGYLDMCNHCNGSEAVNYPIMAAEQVEKPRGKGTV